MSDIRNQADRFVLGEQLAFEEADGLWKALNKTGYPSLARAVLERLRKPDSDCLLDKLPVDRESLNELCRQEALLTSKDQELGVAVRYSRALEILGQRFDLDDKALDGDGETLGIAAGIYKRRWEDLGQYEDLRRSALLYSRGAGAGLKDDAYAHINAAFLEDLLASRNDDPQNRQSAATALRTRIVQELKPSADWWNAASRAEALFGLGRYREAAEVIKGAQRPDLWKLQATTRQFATLARIRDAAPLKNPEILAVFEALLPGAATAVRSAFIGKVGLALSGGGFRASFYHLGVLARLAELNVLRHIDVLSCVSGGSIIGACYWLALRRRLLEPGSLEQKDYTALVSELIEHFEKAVATDVRKGIQPTWTKLAWKAIRDTPLGVLEPEEAAAGLQKHFFAPLAGPASAGPLYMHELAFTPSDHDPALTGPAAFNPSQHNWLRVNKVPALVLNATTVNTGRAWQFTSTWMGESPWAMNEDTDVVERLQWAFYTGDANWRMELSRAVAASAAVPGIFAPLRLGPSYPELEVLLVDGGVCDNQGVLSLLAMNCNALLVSDAAGQLMLQRAPGTGIPGAAAHAMRAMDILMERVRQGTFADLSARRRSGLIRGLMFQHMKAGLDADTIRLPFSQDSYQISRSALSPSGVRKDFQRKLAELRTDLNAFTPNESKALMACGYQMATRTFQKQIATQIPELWEPPSACDWPFADMLARITSTGPDTPARDRQKLLEELAGGSSVKI